MMAGMAGRSPIHQLCDAVRKFRFVNDAQFEEIPQLNHLLQGFTVEVPIQHVIVHPAIMARQAVDWLHGAYSLTAMGIREIGV
jgi:hypothetical protein